MRTGYESVIFGCALFVILVVAVSVMVVLIYRKQMRKIMEKMDKMLDAAIDGKFRESRFDESVLSSLETKLAGYLTSSEVSAEYVKNEKEKIKELLGDISHQTKTPIANLMLYSQLLEEQMKEQAGPEDSGGSMSRETAAASLKAIQKQAEKLKFLIESLVKTSRLETGVLALRPEVNDVEKLIHNAAEQIRLKAEARNISLDIQIRELPSGTMSFDLKWTTEALYNLLDNAVKYSDPGKTVIVATYSYAMFYRIDVIDSGIEIRTEEHEKIFQRFYRAKEVSEQEGVGIGLYLTRQIVSIQGGYLRVTSGKNKETIISMYLPIK